MLKGPEQIKYESWLRTSPGFVSIHVTSIEDAITRLAPEERFRLLNDLISDLEGGKLRVMHPREADDPELAHIGRTIDGKEYSLDRTKDLYRLRVTALEEHDRETDIIPAIK